MKSIGLFLIMALFSSTAMAGMVWTYVDPSGEKFVVTTDFSDKDKQDRGLKLESVSYAPTAPAQQSPTPVQESTLPVQPPVVPAQRPQTTAHQSPRALAGSGTINIQAAPEGTKYFIIESEDVRLVKTGSSPFYDTNFPTGKYKVCFQLDGYQTVWQDATVQTYGSAWVGSPMKQSNNIAQPACEDAIAIMKAEQEESNSSRGQYETRMENSLPSTETSDNSYQETAACQRYKNQIRQVMETNSKLGARGTNGIGGLATRLLMQQMRQECGGGSYSGDNITDTPPVSQSHVIGPDGTLLIRSGSGYIVPQTGQYVPPGGTYRSPNPVVSPNGTVYVPSGPNGYINTRTGQFVPVP